VPEKLRALSLCQPWAEQVLRGEKTIEYRSRHTNIRGRIYLYASRTRYTIPEEAEFAEEVGFDLEGLPRGLLVGTVEIYDCQPPTVIDERYRWFLRSPRRLRPPLRPQRRPQPVWFFPFGR